MQGNSFADKKFIEIKGRKMAYIDEGEGVRRLSFSTATRQARTYGARSCRHAWGSAG